MRVVGLLNLFHAFYLEPSCLAFHMFMKNALMYIIDFFLRRQSRFLSVPVSHKHVRVHVQAPQLQIGRAFYICFKQTLLRGKAAVVVCTWLPAHSITITIAAVRKRHSTVDFGSGLGNSSRNTARHWV